MNDTIRYCLPQVLDLSHIDGFCPVPDRPVAAAAAVSAISAAVLAAGEHLRDLNLDAAQVSDEVLSTIGERCSRLEALSLIGCNIMTDVGLEAVARGCPKLCRLSVGGPNRWWNEARGLAAFRGLKHLVISRRSLLCSDASLTKVLRSWRTSQALF